MNYVFGRDKDHKNAPGVLLGGNMAGYDSRTLAQEFGVTRNLRPDIEKPVWHNSLRLPAGESLSGDEWVKVANDYMEKMGFGPLHPRCYVLHDDSEGQHIHIAASRIALDGSVYLGQNENLASTRIIQQLEIEHGLTVTKGPEYENGKIKMPKAKNLSKPELEKGLRLEVKPPRLVLQELLNASIQEPKTAIQFVQFLEENGVIVMPNLASTGKLNGFSFLCDGLGFKGSSLGEGYKWSNLSKVIHYDQDRDFAELAQRKPVVDNDIGNSGSLESVAGEAGPTDRPGAGTLGPAGQDAGPAPIDHPAIDPRSQDIHSGADAGISSRQGAAGGEDGPGAAPEGHAGVEIGNRLEERSNGVTGAENRDERTDPETDTAVLGGGGGRGGVGRSLGVDDFGAVPVMAWNDRFKKASAARKRGKSLNERRDVDRKAEFERLRDAAHMADLVAYMKGLGLDIKKDGVKDYVVDDRYRVTRKQDGHFVWCSWDQSRGGDPIAFCTEELGRSFQQALSDLSGSTLTPAKPREIASVQHFPSSPPISRNPDQCRRYLEDRGVSPDTITSALNVGFVRFVDYAGTPGIGFCGYDPGHHLRSMTVRLLRPVRSWDGQKEITKIDIRHSDKSFPAIWQGGDPNLLSDRSVWIVEGGVDALAVVDWYRTSKVAVPDIIVSGGSGVRNFFDRPHVQSLLKNAATIYVALEREKNAGVQIETDAGHEEQVIKLQKIGFEVVKWMPPVGSKDIADAWKAGALPDAHDPLAHTRQGGGGGSAPMPTSAPTSTSTFRPE
ncbi:MAG: relaxase/mobilization nuclease domain-containing protein [Acidithiobacillus ferrivorans]